jgi:tripartite ATP-independent transporter DctM subunit
MSEIAIGIALPGGKPGADPDRHAHRRRADAAVVRRRLAIKGMGGRRQAAGSSVSTSIASDAYAVIPLFVLMGLFVSATNMGRDTFDVAARLLRGLRGGLGIATVAANAVFAACTGTTIASASVFTKVAVPEMVRHGYTPKFSVGVVAGSSVLGMLIPPSILMIIFGVIANVSIADLFTAGIVPGVVLALAFCIDHPAAGAISPGLRRPIPRPARDAIPARSTTRRSGWSA